MGEGKAGFGEDVDLATKEGKEAGIDGNRNLLLVEDVAGEDVEGWLEALEGGRL